MSKPLLQPNKFKNSLEDRSMMERRLSNEGLESPKMSKGENFLKSPKAESPVHSDLEYGKHIAKLPGS